MEEPLLPAATPAADSDRPDNSGGGRASSSTKLTALCRISAVLSLAVISLWANYEASKGFDIAVLEAPSTTLAARHYNLMFVSNGGAARAILNASAAIERALYPVDAAAGAEVFPRKPVKSVALRVADHNLTRGVLVTAAGGSGGARYVIHLSPSVIEESDAHGAVVAALHRGMARVWARDGQGEAPAAVMDGVVEYLCRAAGFGSGAVDAAAVAGCEAAADFVGYCEGRRPGFVARLNREMEERWEEGMVETALGSSAKVMCVGFLSGLDWVRGFGNSTRIDGVAIG